MMSDATRMRRVSAEGRHGAHGWDVTSDVHLDASVKVGWRVAQQSEGKALVTRHLPNLSGVRPPLCMTPVGQMTRKVEEEEDCLNASSP